MSRSTSTATRWAATATAAALVYTGVAVATPVYAAGGTTVVTSLADTLDPGTLRSALWDAEFVGGIFTIQFSVTGTIQLESPLPTITTGGIAIEGPGKELLTIQAPIAGEPAPALTYRPIEDGNASISGLTFAGGASLFADFSNVVTETGNGVQISDVIIDGAGDERNQPGIVVVGEGEQTEVVISRTTIKNHNTQDEDVLGSAALISGAGLVVINESTFDNNQGGVYAGGLVLAYNRSTEISGSTFSNNSSELLGGAVFAFGPGPISAFQSTFSGNYSGNSGAAIAAFFTDSTAISHSTITNNVSDGEDGSAVIAVGSQLNVDSSIVSGNVGQSTTVPDLTVGVPASVGLRSADASASGPAVAEALANAEAAVSHNSARIAPLAADDEPSPIFGTLTFSLIGQPKASLDPNAWAIFESTIFEKDAQLGALANNGGNTLTHLPAATSPVIRTGNVETLAGTEYDQRNAPRVVDGRVDIGSVQVQPAAPTPVVPAEAAQLAKTGTGVELPLLAIAGMLLAGVALLAARRRRA